MFGGALYTIEDESEEVRVGDVVPVETAIERFEFGGEFVACSERFVGRIDVPTGEQHARSGLDCAL